MKILQNKEKLTLIRFHERVQCENLMRLHKFGCMVAAHANRVSTSYVSQCILYMWLVLQCLTQQNRTKNPKMFGFIAAIFMYTQKTLFHN